MKDNTMAEMGTWGITRAMQDKAWTEPGNPPGIINFTPSNKTGRNHAVRAKWWHGTE